MWRKYLSTEGTTLIAVLSVALVILVGCSQFVSTQSTVPTAPAQAGDATQIAPIVFPGFVRYALPINAAAATSLIGPAGGTVRAGHFTLTVPAGALAIPVPILIAEVSTLDEKCAIEPTGLAFRKPATLTVSYAGTSADPSSPNYSAGGALSVWWLDPSLSRWKSIGGSDNAAGRSMSVSLQHLSYYALAK